MSNNNNAFVNPTWDNRLIQMLTSGIVFIMCTSVVAVVGLVAKKAFPAIPGWVVLAFCSIALAFFLGKIGAWICFVVQEDETIALRDDLSGQVFKFTKKGFHLKAPWEVLVDGSEGNQETFSRDLLSVSSSSVTADNEYLMAEGQVGVVTWTIQYRNDPDLLGTRNVTPQTEIQNGTRIIMRKRISKAIARQKFDPNDPSVNEDVLAAVEAIFTALKTNVKDPEIERAYGISVEGGGANVFPNRKTQGELDNLLEARKIFQAIVEFVGGPAAWYAMSPDKQEASRVLFMSRGKVSTTSIRGQGGQGGVAAGAAAGAAVGATTNVNNSNGGGVP